MANYEAQNPQKQEGTEEHFITDTEKLVNKHLSDPNHVITDEEMQSLRVGMSPITNNSEDENNDFEERIADHKTIKEDELVPGAQKMTPWDVVDE